ncbi:unnamed protein product [Ixodes hexagonus]
MDAYRQLVSFLKDFCAAQQIDEALPIESLKSSTRKGNEQLADYRIFVGKPAHRALRPRLKQLADELLKASAAWAVPVVKCHIEKSSSYVEVCLHRTAAFHSLFRSIFAEDRRETEQACKQKALVFVPFLDESFSAVRTEKLAGYACACYLEQGMDVFTYTSRPALMLKQYDGVSPIPCVAACEMDAAPDFLSAVERSEYYDKDTSTFNLRKYLEARETDDVPLGYDPNIGNVHIESSAFVMARLLVWLVQSHFAEPPKLLLLVVPSSKSFVAQQAGLLFEILFLEQASGDVCASKVLYLTHEGSTEPTDCSFEKYRSERQDYVREAFQRPHTAHSLPKRSKTTEDIFVGGESGAAKDLESSVAVLVETELTFDFLSSKQNLRIKIEERLNRADNGHYSLQYTAARIAAVLNKYEAAVKDGAYPALCSLEEADFSLLNLQPEWMLWHRLLVCWRLLFEPSPAALHGNPIKVEVNAHALCKTLEGLSSEFSTYYSKVRILIQPEQHLLKTVCARLWLLKAVQRTLERLLRRLDLAALDKM